MRLSQKIGPSLNAIGTNVLARFLLQDDPEQFALARKLFETETVYITLTVLLETFWVLRKRLAIPQSEVLQLLSALSRLPNAAIEDAPRFGRTMALTETGMGFADALHLSAVDPDMRFATFDRRMFRAAQRAGIQNVYTP